MLEKNQMVRRFLWIVIGVSIAGCLHAVVSEMIELKADTRAKMPLVLCWLAEQASVIEPLMPCIARDFRFSGQMDVCVKKVAIKPSLSDIKQLFSEGYSLAMFVTQGSGDSIEWRLFDTCKGSMIEGKRCIKRSDHVDGRAHQVADSAWPVLTGQGAFFSSKIAYCKQVEGRRARHVCIADYDGHNEQVLVDLPTIMVAPRWNNDMANPLLFYSEYTNDNIRLMCCSVDGRKQRSIASNFDGVTMLPAFSRDGTKVAYCASHGKGCCQLYYGKQGTFKQLTHNQGNNISPSLNDDGSCLFFCSDFQTGKPQIYQYTIENELIERITNGGYCVSPSYCGKRHQVAYGKMERGVMQLYLYDVARKQHTRLTSDAGNKEEFSWSPCGNYLLFSVDQAGKSRIAVLNLLTHQRVYITPSGNHCTYPSWSGLYNAYLRV